VNATTRFFRKQDSNTATFVATSKACTNEGGLLILTNSPCVANYFEMFALRTSGQLHVHKAMLSSSLEGRNNNKNNGRVA
jgi:hypothetical protein